MIYILYLAKTLLGENSKRAHIGDPRVEQLAMRVSVRIALVVP